MEDRWMRMLLVLGLVGCGISDDTLVNDLTEEDWTVLCEDLAVGSQERSQDCGQYTADMPMVTVEECVSDALFLTASCDATVADWRTCNEARETVDLCSPDWPDACAVLSTCDPLTQ